MLDDPKPPTPLNAHVLRVFERCVGTFAERTLKGCRADIAAFSQWCAGQRGPDYPVEGETIAAFIESESARVSPSMLKRRLAAIRLVHVYGDHPDPTKASAVRLAMRRAVMRKARRPNQAEGLAFAHLAAIRAACSKTRAGLRDAALISLGCYTLCRACELAALEVQDLDLDSGSVLIRRKKPIRPAMAAAPGCHQKRQVWCADGLILRVLLKGRFFAPCTTELLGRGAWMIAPSEDW